jgi:hypothetical protein
MCPGHGVEIAQKEKEKHPRPVSAIGRETVRETKGRSGDGLIRLPETLEMIGPCPATIYKRFSIY